ncbi:putative toxin-antitoxin system toxin component, PIN family [archaeon SCG-AAA382B04]|nr:putative toxin-antitoxin system toxin component, PIN family [archaeon SCG-AAA382B04]
MGKVRVVLDSNVLISALGWDGKPKDCFDLMLNDEIISFISPDLLEEFSKVMDYPKFGFTKEEKEKFLEIFLEKALIVKPENQIEVLKEDKSDNRVLECALDAKVDFIVSGDSHLLDLEEFRGIEILNVSQFLERMKG